MDESLLRLSERFGAKTPDEKLVVLAQKIIDKHLDANQREMLAFVVDRILRGDRLIVIKASRQLGKSWFAVALSLVCQLLVPACEVKFGAPSGKMARAIIRPHFQQMVEELPSSMWNFSSQQGEYTFYHPKGSTSHVVIGGCDATNVDSLRGQRAHIAIVDEAGFVSDLTYAVNDVLMPQTVTTNGVVILISTPAKSVGHPFKRFSDEAEKEGRCIRKTIYDCPRISEKEIRNLMKAARGEASSTWRREYLCEDVPDASTAILPNATTARLAQLAVVPDSAAKETYIACAIGFGPRNSGILAAYYDVANRAVVIEDEAEIQGMDTSLLAAEVSRLESKCWNGVRPYRRIGNFSAAMQGEVLKKHGLRVAPAIPLEWTEMANNVRLRINDGGLRIKLTCEGLLRQMGTASWNGTAKDFEPTADDANHSLVQALLLLCQNVRESTQSSTTGKQLARLIRGRR